MLCKILSATSMGIDCQFCTVEVDCSRGLPTFNMVGFLSSESKEAKSRVKIAIKNSGFNFDNKKITVNVAPASIKKNGSSLDLPICCALLYNMGHIKRYISSQIFIVGEICLDGSINRVNGIINMLLTARKNGCTICFIPNSNLIEASLVEGITIIGIRSLQEIVSKINSKDYETNCPNKTYEVQENNSTSFSSINSQDHAIRIALIACCGKHNIIFSGSYGIGKSLLAKAMLYALPPMNSEEILEVNSIYSSMGLNNNKLILKRPVRSPHHSITTSSLIGGGKNPVCGEITLAHKGILFLDELGLYKKSVLDNLRQPIENKKVTIIRNNQSLTFPADTMIIGTMNSCPCGEFPNLEKCRCSKVEIKNYQKKISSALLDRIDLMVCLEKPSKNNKSTYSDEDILKTIRQCWQIQFKRNNNKLNSELSLNEILNIGNFSKSSIENINNVFSNLKLSLRGYARVLKISRTIADIDNSKSVEISHANEALLIERVRQW